MRLFRLLAVGLIGLVFCAGPARADTPAKPVSPPSPLRLIPAEADVLLEVKDPTRLADLVRKLDLLEQIQAFAIVKEQLDSTQVRRACQLLAYVEKTLGKKWPELLDRLAGGGVALGIKFGSANAPFVLVVQGKDEKFVQKALELALAILKDELARQESKDEIKKGDYEGIPAFKIGKDLLLARVGAALVLSNRKEAMGKALNLHLGKEKASLLNHASVAEAAKLLPEAPLANIWLNMAPIHESEGGKAVYKSPRDNFQLTVLIGEYLDILGRSPFLCAGLHAKKDGFLFTIRSPRGRDGMGPDGDLKVPPAGKEGSRPLLEPKGTLYSSSFYLDFSRFWKDREKLFPKVQADAMTAFDKTSGRNLGGVKFSALLEAAGAHHRLIAVNQPKVGYTKTPQQLIPAFAFVTEARHPDKFARYVETLVRFGGLAATTQFKLKLAEETHNGHEIVGYRFDEKAELKADVTDFRFNFSPSYVRIDNQFVFCSTIELCRELIDLLIAEKKSPGKSTKDRGRDRFFATGFADLIASTEDLLIAQTILDQAVPPGEAKEQIQTLIKLVRNLGTLSSKTHYHNKEFHYELQMRTGK